MPAQSHRSESEFPVLLRSLGKRLYRTKPSVCRSTAFSVSSLSASPSPIATGGILCSLQMFACCDYLLMMKMTCAVNWIIVRKGRSESTSLSHFYLAGPRGKTVSGHLELKHDIWMQWMTMTSVVPCHAIHIRQHDATLYTAWGRHYRWKTIGFRESPLKY